MSAGEQWYWCFEHNRAEHAGEQCRAEGRLGPYPSEDAAKNWKARTEARNQSWEAEDERWEDG